MRKKRVLVGMSGGLDSTMTAVLLKKKGYEVMGVTLIFYPNDNSLHDSAANIAKQINIPHIVLNKEKLFSKDVIGKFTREYLSGNTPSICLHCNPELKFPSLLEAAQQMNCDFIATGHYINLINEGDECWIEKGRDTLKDQSYFLWNLPQEILNRWKTPLGGYEKKEIRSLASNMGLEHLSKKKESMGVCFLQNADYRSFLQKNADTEIQKIGRGDIRDEKGNLLGSHSGFPFYTIGQKKGLHLTNYPNWAVLEIQKKTNTLVVGSDDRLFTKSIMLTHPLLRLSPDKLTAEDITIKVRGLGRNPSLPPAHAAFIGEELHIQLHDPAWAMAPGQPVVIYKGNRVVGGGIYRYQN